MEVSGVVLGQVPCTRSSKISIFGVSFGAGSLSSGELAIGSSRPRKLSGALKAGFSDNGHLQYYKYVGPMCGGGKKEKKDSGSDSGAATTKKKLKLLKGLTKDLSKLSELGLDSDYGLLGEVQGKMISDAADQLLKQLQHLREEEKQLKKIRKQEKAKLKATRMNMMVDCESSSESSDSECEEAIDMSRLRSQLPAQPAQAKLDELHLVSQETATASVLSSLIQEGNRTEENGLGDHILQNEVESRTRTNTSCCSSSVGRDDGSSSATGASAKMIEVCMGNKCKKSGAGALLEEFERVMGTEGAVVGCKCMGKCRDGPNVRVLNCVDGSQGEGVDVSVGTPSNPLCIGVGLEDVGVIVANFFGEDQKDLGLAAAL